MKGIKLTKKQKSEIKDFCYNYGYYFTAAELENNVETGESVPDELLLTTICDYPDNFYDLLDEYSISLDEYSISDVDYYCWNEQAEQVGRAAALKDYTGKDYSIHCDGYRVVAVVGNKQKAIDYALKKASNINWEHVSFRF